MLAYDETKCIGCGFCVEVCPCFCIAQEEKGKTPHYVEGQFCIECGHCVSVCPKGALSHSRLNMDLFSHIENTASIADVDNLFKSKRSIRHFKDKAIDEEILEQMMEALHFAPTDANSQDTGLVVMTDRDKIDALEAYIIEGFKMYVAYAVNTQKLSPETVEVSRSQRIIDHYNEGLSPIFHKAPCVIFCYAQKDNLFGWYNSAVAMDYMSLKAHAMGIGSCVIGRAMYETEPIAKFLNLAEDKKIYVCMTFGYPKYKYRLSTPKKAINVRRI